MEYGSFYGGRRGASFIIKKSFESISDMTASFAQGNFYRDVGYQDYVLINSPNKNNPDNGKIFRRGINFNDTTNIQYYRYNSQNDSFIKSQTACHGAEYIGTIAGPPGPAPTMQIVKYNSMDSHYGVDNDGEEVDVSTYAKHGTLTVQNNDLLPGKNGSSYNDKIYWRSVTLRDSSGDAQVLVGFKIPYPVIEFTATTEYGKNEVNVTRVHDDEDDGTHPFYEKWNIKVPQNAKGDALKNLRVVIPIGANASTTTNSEVQELRRTSIYNPENKTALYYTSDSALDIVNRYQILVYDEIDYSSTAAGTTKTYYLGDYNQISGITITQDGTITIEQTHDSFTASKLIKWISNITYDTTAGQIVVTYNNGATPTRLPFQDIDDIQLTNEGSLQVKYRGDQDYTTIKDEYDEDIFIRWVDGIELSSDGVLTVTYNTVGADGVQDTQVININPIQWINDIELTDDGFLNVTYNTVNENHESIIETINQNFPVKWVNSMSLDTSFEDWDDASNDTGLLSVTYNTGDQEELGKIVWPHTIQMSPEGNITTIYSNKEREIINDGYPIKHIDLTSLSPDGFLTFTYNTLAWNSQTEEYETETETVNELYPIKYIEDINFSNDGEIQVVYNTYERNDDGSLSDIHESQIINEFDSQAAQQNPDYQDRRIKWVKSIQMDQLGELTYTDNTNTDYLISNEIFFPTSFSFNPSDGFFYTTYLGGSEPFILNEREEGDILGNPIPVRWVTGVALSQDGNVTLSYNFGEDDVLNEKITWIEDINMTDDGQLTFYYNDFITDENNQQSRRQFVPTQKIKWVDEVSLDQQQAKLAIRYNTDAANEQHVLANNFKWVDQLSFNNGLFTLKLSNQDTNLINTQLTWPTNITVTDSGAFDVTWNDIDTSTGQARHTVQSNQVKWIKDVTYDESAGLNYTFNTDIAGSDPHHLADAFNYIKDTKIAGDHHLLLLYSDQSKAAELTNQRTIDNQIWADLGSVYEYAGILVGLTIDTASGADVMQLQNSQSAIQYLNEVFPNGLTGDVAGKIVTIGSVNSVQKFYAFNYGHSLADGTISDKKWFLLGSLSQNTAMCVGRANSDGTPYSQVTDSEISALTTGGIWFMTEEWGDD